MQKSKLRLVLGELGTERERNRKEDESRKWRSKLQEIKYSTIPSKVILLITFIELTLHEYFHVVLHSKL